MGVYRGKHAGVYTGVSAQRYTCKGKHAGGSMHVVHRGTHTGVSTQGEYAGRLQPWFLFYHAHFWVRAPI